MKTNSDPGTTAPTVCSSVLWVFPLSPHPMVCGRPTTKLARRPSPLSRSVPQAAPGRNSSPHAPARLDRASPPTPHVRGWDHCASGRVSFDIRICTEEAPYNYRPNPMPARRRCRGDVPPQAAKRSRPLSAHRCNGDALGMRNTGRTDNAFVRVAAHGPTGRARFRKSLPQGQTSSPDTRASCGSIRRCLRNGSGVVPRLRPTDRPSARDRPGWYPGGPCGGVALYEVNRDSAT
jgi:hypothetical protein